MTPSLPATRGRIVLGGEDFALLTRLRTVALILRAGAATQPALGDIAIVLLLDRSGLVHPLRSLSLAGRRLLAHANGWPDILLAAGTGSLIPVPFAFEDTARAELPTGCPAGLLRLLRQIGAHTPLSAASKAGLARAGWVHDVDVTDFFRPRVPITVSALEALDALVAVDSDGGLGDGPLAVLARAVAARLTGGQR